MRASVLSVLWAAATAAQLAWIVSAGVVRVTGLLGRKIPAARRVFWELRPFYWPAVVAVILTQDLTAMPHRVDVAEVVDVAAAGVYATVTVTMWLLFKDSDDDDNRWHRRWHRVTRRLHGGSSKTAPTR